MNPIGYAERDNGDIAGKRWIKTDKSTFTAYLPIHRKRTK
jgi:hypothetical protein